ncbi:hypothetical protein ACEQ8H_008625 [Pleosporales sp. CAS-2024a]
MTSGKSNLLRDTIQAIKACPPEIFNFWLFFCTAAWSFSGVAKGFDEGNIASIVVQKTFRKRFGVDHETDAQYANTKGWIVSIATAGAVFGCLACVNLVQILGRKRTMLLFTLVYMAGIVGQTCSNGNLSALYASRFLSGIGIGATTVLPSIYLTEVAPRSIRGLITLQYACCQQLGVVFGFFFNYGITKHNAGTQLQWQLPTALQLIPAFIWGIAIFFTPESPRFLLSQNKNTEALAVLVDLRKLPAAHAYVQEEFTGIETQLNTEIEAVSDAGVWDLVNETFTITEYRRRFVLMFLCHMFGQWSGANAITQYSPSIFGYLGIQGQESTFLATGLYAVVKFASTLIFSIFVIDFMGRRRSLMLGISLQIITLAFVGAYLGAIKGKTVAQIEASSSIMAASKASIVAIYLHAVAWSIGWFSIPYLLSAEVFPVRIRSLNVSILMAFHWAFYFGCSRAMPSLLAATDKYGAFAFFASICTVSLVFVFFALPETAGRSLESLDKMFERPWYTVRRVAYPTPADLADGGLRDAEHSLDAGSDVDTNKLDGAQVIEVCSRDAPVCLQCRNASATCVRRRFGSNVHQTDGGSEAGIEALKNRIENMKAQLRENTSTGRPASDDTRPDPSPTMNRHSDVHVQHQQNVNAHEGMQNNVAYLSLSAMAERTDGEPFATDGMSYLTLLYAATGINGANPTLSNGNNEFLTGSLAEFRHGESLNIDLEGTEMLAAFQRYMDLVKMNFPFMSSADLKSAYETIRGSSHDEILPETYVSTTLDRPFCLNDRDILASVMPPDIVSKVDSPLSMERDTDTEIAIVHQLVLHAKMIRSIRDSTETDTGILCHYINICCWGERQTDIILEKTKVTLLARGFVELLKCALFFADPDRAEVSTQVMDCFSQFIEGLENQINAQSGAVPSMDAVTIFAIGVLVWKHILPEGDIAMTRFKAGQILSHVQDILTTLAARQPAVRSLRNIISALNRSGTVSDSQQDLRLLVTKSEMVISRQIQALLFHPTFLTGVNGS